MTVPEKAVEWALSIANDSAHGYDQTNRWGPDYDCSSFVISAYKHAGIPLTSTYTGNMRNDFINNGFAIPVNIDVRTGAGLIAGDVLLNEMHHTALYIGNYQIVHATGNEYGKATGGKTGDQGREITTSSYYNFPWDFVLRYVRKEETAVGTYTVKSGDSLWSIAEKTLGSGMRYKEIQTLNNLYGALIYPGQVLKIPGNSVSLTTFVKPDTYNRLREEAEKLNLTIGEMLDEVVGKW